MKIAADVQFFAPWDIKQKVTPDFFTSSVYSIVIDLLIQYSALLNHLMLDGLIYYKNLQRSVEYMEILVRSLLGGQPSPNDPLTIPQ